MAERQRQRAQTPEGVQAQPGNNEVTIDLVELMYRLLANWKLIVCITMVFTIVAGVYTFYFVTPMYEATSTIYVLSRRDSAINMADLQIGTALTEDYIKVFKMWEVHEEVISNLNLPYDYTEISRQLNVVNESGTRMLDIKFTSPSAEEAAAVANEYAKVGSQYIMDTMSTDKPNIMSVALVPANPVTPNKTRNILLGFLLGMILSCGFVTVQMMVDDKYKTPEDIRNYAGLATLASIPIETKTTGKGKTGGRRKA